MFRWLKSIWVNIVVWWTIKIWGTGTADDYRNPFWRLTEYLAVKVLWAYTILDIRLFHIGKDDKWRVLDIRLPYKTEQNFWNGFFTIQIYLVAWRFFIWPKLHIVFRPCKRYYLLIGTPGLLFDRGEIHAKFALMDWQQEKDIYGCNEPTGWEEGSV